MKQFARLPSPASCDRVRALAAFKIRRLNLRATFYPAIQARNRLLIFKRGS